MKPYYMPEPWPQRDQGDENDYRMPDQPELLQEALPHRIEPNPRLQFARWLAQEGRISE